MSARAPRHRPSKTAVASVEAYLSALEHPYKKGIHALRRAILAADDRIREEVKWNAPSFYLERHFATFRLHPRSMFQLIFHQGGKKSGASKRFHLNDPDGMLIWPAKDRCVLEFQSDQDAIVKRAEVVRFVRLLTN